VTGGPLARVEDAALLTGRGRFLDDLSPLPGTLAAAIVRSPHAHARIRGIDLSRARNAPGVAAVIGPEEVLASARPFPLSVRAPMPYYPCGTDKVRFVGEPVAVVVAGDRYLAEDAAELVVVDYERLPAVTGTREAAEPRAPKLHDDADGNVATDRTFAFGDFDAATARAHRVITRDYSFPRYSSTPMECYSVIADWQDTAEGPEVTAWANFHGPFSMVPVVASALGLPMSRFRLIVPPDIGGSFGIKAGIYPYVVLMALASKHAGRPVRWTEDRLEHLVASSAGADREMTFTAAVDDQARITALSVDLIDNVGAYLRPPEPSTLYRCFGNVTGAYRIPVVKIRARAVVTNKTPTGLNRGFGGQQLYFGLERIVDDIADACGLDPAEVRRRNLIDVGQFPYLTPSGGRYDSGDYHAALDLALDAAHYDKRRQQQREAREADGPAGHDLIGIGVATVTDPSATNIGYVGLATPAEQRAKGRGKSGSTEHVRISFDPQGVVTVLLGTVPQGQGHATVARDVVAARLGLPAEAVVPRVEMDTATTPWTITSGSYSSRFAPLVTSALVEAADEVARSIKVAAGVLLDTDPGDLELADGQVRARADPARAVAFRHAAGLIHWDPGSLPPGARASSHAEAAFTPPEATAATADDQINSSLCYGFVAEVVTVRIDRATLKVAIEDVTTVHDPGTVLNRTLLEGQVHGALVQALGGALYEEMRYTSAGQPQFGTFMDYLCPTSAEADFRLTSLLRETPSPVTRLGAKGSGEGSSMSFPVALANAVADALRPLGIIVSSLPLSPTVLHDLLAAGPQPRTVPPDREDASLWRSPEAASTWTRATTAA
jgi:2-furoyl-CoA dehydrogenase large subunit